METGCDSAPDIITNLPDNVIDNILICLPIRDAARTAILSSQWRWKWVKAPHLVLDDAICRGYMHDQVSARREFMVITQRMLLTRRGPILKFTCSLSMLETCSEIDQVILFVLRNGVRELTLHFSMGEHHKLPPSLFSCPQLTHLDLQLCLFKPPLTFIGFGKLTSLELHEVIITADIFTNLISSCPLLERVELETTSIFEYLEIVSPILKCLIFKGVFKFVRLVKALLVTVQINLTDPMDEEVLNEGGTANLIELFGSAPVIENLLLGYHYFKSLATGGISKTFNHLKVLLLSEICLGDKGDVEGVLSMMHKSPNLQKFAVEVYPHDNAVTGNVLEDYSGLDYGSISFHSLRQVEMRDLSGSRPELEFVKFLLAKSPLLEKMIIKPNPKKVVDGGLRILKQVVQFQRLSANAKVLFKDT